MRAALIVRDAAPNCRLKLSEERRESWGGLQLEQQSVAGAYFRCQNTHKRIETRSALLNSAGHRGHGPVRARNGRSDEMELHHGWLVGDRSICHVRAGYSARAPTQVGRRRSLQMADPA